MRTNKIFSYVVLGVLLLSANTLLAQIYGNGGRLDKYTATSTATTYSTISGTGTLLGSGDDNAYQLALPFNFTFDNIGYAQGTNITVYTNGGIQFVSGGTNRTDYSPYLGYLSGTTPYRPNYIWVYGRDMYVGTGIYWQVTGSSPNRKLTIDYYLTRPYNNTTYTTSMQVNLYEKSNAIELVYATNNYSFTTSYPGGIGLSGNASPSYMFWNKTTFSTVGSTSTATNQSTATPTTNIIYMPPPNVQLSSTPKVMNFGSQFTGVATLGIVTVTHAGTEATLNLGATSIGGANGSDFTIVSGPNPSSSLGVGGTATYTIQFVPSFGGARNATFTVSSNGVDSGTQTISLTGVGIAPLIQVTPSQLFKSKRVLVNDTIEQSIIISSVGQASLFFTNYPNSFVFSGDNPGDYIISKRPPNPLPAGGTDTLKIKFVPKAEGARFAQVDVLSNAQNSLSWPVLLKGIGIVPRIVVGPTFLDYDSTAVSTTQCSKITVYNPGSDSLRITNHYFTSNDNDFSFTPLTGQKLVVAPNDSVKVDICFTPLQKGTRQARFRVTAKIPQTIEQFPRDTNFVDVEIRGNATPLDKSIIAIKDFSNNPIVGEDAATTLELSNTGTDPVVVKAPVITGANASEFTVSKVNFPATVAPGNSISMTVTAKPLARGERKANIAFNLTSEGRPFSVNTDVKATALQASASCVASAVTFDKLLLGESITKTVELTNTGDINQTFTATLTGSDAFSLDNTAIEVLGGAKGTYTVTFAPMAEGKLTGTLTIKGSHIADMTVALNGTGEKKEVVTQSVGKVSEADGFTLEQNAPNPAVGYTNFTFTAPKQSTVRLYLADMSGKMVKEIANSNFSGGKHSLKFDTKELASGSYVYILESGATRIMRQMVVTK